MSEAAGGAGGAVGGDVGGGQGGGDSAGAQQAQTPRMLKLMLDNKEVELPESEVVGHYKRGREAGKILTEAQKRKEEALRTQAATEGLVSRLKKGGSEARAALRDLGVDPAKVGEEEILEMIQREKMSPAERREYELQQKLKGYEDEKSKAEEDKKTAAHKQEVDRHTNELAGIFTDAMAVAGLPKSAAPVLFPRMASLYAQNEKAGLESTPEEMAHHAMEGVRELHTAMWSKLDGAELLEALGPDVLKKVLAANLQRSSPQRIPGVPSPQRPTPKPTAAPKGTGELGADRFRRLREGDLG